ncbi:MAG: hypothetical protein U5R31_13040 [Acidimicrobiia bacterium]|nr:hypothetical protein [Acidimicrobiia bacterium]
MRASMGNMPELNLQQARAAYGDAAKYTLQVAVYREQQPPGGDAQGGAGGGGAGGEESRRSTTTGSSRSMVTIGVFNDDDFDADGRDEPELMSLARRHPYNLLNGMGIEDPAAGTRCSGRRPGARDS